MRSNVVLMSRHRATLRKIEQRSGLPKWGEVEAMFQALGAEVEERSGSRVRITLRGAGIVFHRPHPQPEISKPTRNDIRKFLVSMEVIR